MFGWLTLVLSVLILLGVFDAFWGGTISGFLMAILTNEVLLHMQSQKSEAANTKPFKHA
ncbi:hypothetical protein GCM10028895_41470 [Pontibacter rugosus]